MTTDAPIAPNSGEYLPVEKTRCNWLARAAYALVGNGLVLQYHSAYLTSGCFSPTRAGVFFVTRMDGVVDIWDYFYRQNEVAYSHKVRESPYRQPTPGHCEVMFETG